MSFLLGTQPIWAFGTNDTRWAANGTITAYRQVAPSEKKAFYQDAAGSNPYPNPATLDAKGAIAPIYWNDDEPYLIVIKDSAGNTLWTIENYVPAGSGTSPPITETKDFTNFIENPEYHWVNASEYSGTDLGTSAPLLVSDYWFYEKSTTGATEKLEFIDFLAGQADVTDGSPRRFFRFSCSIAGSGESYRRFYNQTEGVQQFQNTPTSFSFWARSSLSNSVTLGIRQRFGTGGSADVTDTVQTFALTPTWTKYISNNYSVPSIGGKTIGTAGDDLFDVYFELPLNTISEVDIVTSQVNIGTQVQEFDYRTDTQKRLLIEAGHIPEAAIDYRDDLWMSITRQSTNRSSGYSFVSNPPVGSIIAYPVAAVPDGYLECNGNAFLRSVYPRLFNAIGTAYTPASVAYRADAVRTGNIVTVTNSVNGPVTDAADVSTGFVIATTQQGSPTQPEIFTATCNAASTISPGSYFTFHTTSNNYSVFYIVDGSGFELIPPLPGFNKVVVYINSYDDADTVAEKTKDLLNPTAFALPDYRGWFLRGWNHGAGVDPDAASRTARLDGVGGDVVGSEQQDEFESHLHTFETTNFLLSGGTENLKLSTTITPTGTYPTSSVGASETRPKNKNVMWIIKY